MNRKNFTCNPPDLVLYLQYMNAKAVFMQIFAHHLCQMVEPIRTGGAAADCGQKAALLIELKAQIV